jgi:hypothetical protein
VTIGEIREGIETLPDDDPRRGKLCEWFENQIIDYWNTNSYEDEPVIAISNNKSYVFHYNIFEEYDIEVQHLDRFLNFIRTANANIVYYQSKESE